MQRLKLLYQNTRQEFHRTPLQWIAAAFLVTGTIIHVGISLMDCKLVSSNPVIKLLQEKVEGNLLLLLISISVLVWALFLLIKRNKEIKSELLTQITDLQNQLLQYTKFTHYNELLWLPDDPTPLCPRCYESDNKTIHMKFERITMRGYSDIERYSCPTCNNFTDISKHPKNKTTQSKSG